MTSPITPTPIGVLPPAPLVTDTPAQFDAKAFPFAAALDTLRTQTNTQSLQTNQNAVSAWEAAAEAEAERGGAEDARDESERFSEISAANANFYGPWSALSGPLDMPASVSYGGKDWRLTRNLTDVASEVPGVSSAWQAVSVARVLSEWAQFTSSSTFTCPYSGVVRAYALGKGANGTSTYGGGGGSMGYGDIPVAEGDLLQINITGGVCTISKNGVQMLRGNAATGQSGATATANHVAVSNGGSLPGGNGGVAGGGNGGGGGGAGSPLGQGGSGGAGGAPGGGGGLAGNATSRGGGGVGYPGEQGGGGSGGPAAGSRGGVGRTPWTAYKDPLLTFANGPGASYVGTSPVAASNGGGAAGYGGAGGFGGGGSGGWTDVSGGDGGFGGGGGCTASGAGFRGGNGGFGGGGGGAPSTATQGLGGAAWAGLFY